MGGAAVLPTPDRFPPLDAAPARQREETFRLMLEWLHVRAARGPVLFVVEDLHWADASTLEFLGNSSPSSGTTAILALLTFRPEFKPPWAAVGPPDQPGPDPADPAPGRRPDAEEGGGALPDAVIEQVYDRAGGVPLFVEEFTKMVQESAVLDQARRAARPARSGTRSPARSRTW